MVPIWIGMTQAQREVTNHIEFQVSLLKLLAVPESYGTVKPEQGAASRSEQAQMEELVARVNRQ